VRGSIKGDAESVSVSSARWRAVGLVLTPVVFLSVLRAAIYVVQADGTLQAASTDYAQAYLGIGGVLLGLLALCSLAFGVLISIDCAVNLAPWRVRVANLRSVWLAWPMIDGVTTFAAGRRLIPALHLVNGEVVPIRMAARLPARTQPDSVIASSAALSLVSTALSKRSPGQSSWLVPPGGTLVRGRLMRSRQLPGPVTADIPRSGIPQLWWRALRRFMFSGLGLASFEIHSGVAAMVKLGAVGVTYSAVFCLAVLAVDTVRIRRKLVFGADFVAWRPVASRSWRVLPFRAVAWADAAPGLASGFRNVPAEHNIQLRRSDGRGVTVRRPELQAGAAAAVLAALEHSPAITKRAVETLTANASAGHGKLALAD
jgi:hypothetical protein